jgi:hypothetical protein
MKNKLTLAVVAAGAALFFAAPQAANALPQVSDAKQVSQTNVEKAGYRGHRRGWRNRYYRRHHYRGGNRYYRHRRPGFGVYLGF